MYFSYPTHREKICAKQQSFEFTDLDAIASQCPSVHRDSDVIVRLPARADAVKLSESLSVKPRQVNVGRPALHRPRKITTHISIYFSVGIQ